jgi:hypothetical protein
MSIVGLGLMVLLILALVSFAYLVGTRGFERAKADMLRSFYDVGYAMKETSTDAALTAKVKVALSLDKRIPAKDIHVETDDGVVTLRGRVSDDQTRALAGQVAGDTPGVLQVHNELDVMTSGK